MALQKQPVNINFSKGLNTKSDPFQISISNFLALNNSVFDTEGRLTKRNGYPLITTLPTELQTNLTTLNDNLLATGSNIEAYSQATKTWIDKGIIQPVHLSTQPLVRVSTSQTGPDAAVSSNGLTCLAYMDSGSSYYQVTDSSTGEQIVTRVTLESTATNPRVFLLGRYFIITYMATITASPHLRYVAIPVANPSSPRAPTDVSTAVSAITDGYDGYVANNSLYMAWSGSGSTVKVAYLSSSLVLSAPVSLAAHTSTLMSVTADISSSTPVIWVTFWDTSSSDGYTAAFNQILSEILAPTQIINNVVINEITSIADSGSNLVFFENDNTYTFSSIKTDYISTISILQDGTIGSTDVILRSVGLASKPFEVEDTTYILATYGEANQPTYFLIDSIGRIYMRLAYSNGGGYKSSQVLPTVSDMDGTYMVPYEIKDFLASVNKNTDLPSGTPVNGIYTQTGINLASFTINDSQQYSSEIAGSLHLTGGQLWQYDSVRAVEHGFQVWPEDLEASTVSTSPLGGMIPQTYFYSFTYEWTDNQGNLHRSAPSIPLEIVINTPPATFTGNRTSGSAIISGISSTANLQAGQGITGTGIPADTSILSVDSGTQITMSTNASSGTATSTVITVTAAASVNINVPTLRLTYKVAPNPVRIVGYRWSAAQQVYYQFTSITSPIVNDTTIDSLSITDSNSDAQILGQTLLYTTGGVVENIAAPASIDSALFRNRLFLIDAEDRNLLWYSKVVIENTPVELSDLFTLYVAPTSGTQGSTGTMTAISAMDDKLIIFKRDAIYYITGIGPDNTGANDDFTDPIFITSSVGCNNPDSIVLMTNGIMFQSDKGIWLLGRDLSTTYIGNPVEAYNDIRVASAEAIPNTNEVRFILPNGVTLMYDYFYGQWGTFNNVYAISGCLYQNLHTYLNRFGQVYQEKPGTYLDGSNPVLLSLTTAWLSLAGLQGFERFYFMNLLGTYITPFKLNVQLAYDFNSNAIQNVIVTPDNFTPYYGDESPYGGGPAYGGPGNVFTARVFPQKQKCQTVQISITEIYDPSYGIAAGEGLTLSGITATIGTKRGFRTQRAAKSFG